MIVAPNHTKMHLHWISVHWSASATTDFDVLLKSRFQLYFIFGDLQEAFLQILIKPDERKYQALLWYDDVNNPDPKEFQFIWAIFGSTSSPYILGATIERHLDNYNNQEDKVVVNALKDLIYVDDLIFHVEYLSFC